VSNLKSIDYTTFGPAISGSLCIVEFWAEWCAPCHAMNSVLEELAARHFGTIEVFKVNADDNRTLLSQYHVGSIPTLLFFHEGKLVDRMQGLQSIESIELILTQIKQTSYVL